MCAVRLSVVRVLSLNIKEFIVVSGHVLVMFNPLTPELNPSAQLCLTRVFTGYFSS
jgi:hypothetical protein